MSARRINDMVSKIITLVVVLLSSDSVSYAAYTRMPSQSASDAALSSMVGHIGLWIIIGVLYVAYRIIKNFFNKK